MPLPLLPLALALLGGGYVLVQAKRGKSAGAAPRSPGGVFLPAEAFSFYGSEAGPLSGARAFRNEYAELALTKLLRYAPSGSAERFVEPTFKKVEYPAFRMRAALKSRGKFAEGGLPKTIVFTPLDHLRTAGIPGGGKSIGLASITLATVPIGKPVSALTFNAMIDDLRLFPPTIEIVTTQDPALAVRLTQEGPSVEKKALGLSNVTLAVLSSDLGLLRTIPTNVQDLLTKLSK